MSEGNIFQLKQIVTPPPANLAITSYLFLTELFLSPSFLYILNLTGEKPCSRP